MLRYARRAGSRFMTKAVIAALAGLLLTWSATAQNLQSALAKMDAAAAQFRSAQADFVWDQYQLVVDETDTQKGQIYFRRAGNETQMMAVITDPDKKFVLFKDGMVRLYQPKIEQVTEYKAGKNKDEVESFLVLGFGGSGRELQRSFAVKYAGLEKVEGTDTWKLELTPKSQRARGIFEQIILWIDTQRGISVRQKLIEPSGDYRLAKYSNIRLNEPVNDDTFKLKTTSKTKTVTPQS
jgi:outer membrane lipoprotein-sorting protein